jgi:hypothetical protein
MKEGSLFSCCYTFFSFIFSDICLAYIVGTFFSIVLWVILSLIRGLSNEHQIITIHASDLHNFFRGKKRDDVGLYTHFVHPNTKVDIMNPCVLLSF